MSIAHPPPSHGSQLLLQHVHCLLEFQDPFRLISSLWIVIERNPVGIREPVLPSDGVRNQSATGFGSDPRRRSVAATESTKWHTSIGWNLNAHVGRDDPQEPKRSFRTAAGSAGGRTTARRRSRTPAAASTTRTTEGCESQGLGERDAIHALTRPSFHTLSSFSTRTQQRHVPHHR